MHQQVEGATLDGRGQGHGSVLPEAHVRHCVDLLRNSLMCRPDLTVEMKNEKLEGVTGFGTEHQCVNWGDVLAWTREWEDWVP